MGKLCQSCGLPMHKDPSGGGSEKGGAKSEEYCSYCYRDGAFLVSNIDVKQMQEICIDKMKDKGVPRWLGWLFTRNLPSLKRWKESVE